MILTLVTGGGGFEVEKSLSKKSQFFERNRTKTARFLNLKNRDVDARNILSVRRGVLFCIEGCFFFLNQLLIRKKEKGINPAVAGVANHANFKIIVS